MLYDSIIPRIAVLGFRSLKRSFKATSIMYINGSYYGGRTLSLTSCTRAIQTVLFPSELLQTSRMTCTRHCCNVYVEIHTVLCRSDLTSIMNLHFVLLLNELKSSKTTCLVITIPVRHKRYCTTTSGNHHYMNHCYWPGASSPTVTFGYVCTCLAFNSH